MNYDLLNNTIRRKSNLNITFWFSLFVVLLPFLYQYKGIGSILSLGELALGFVTIVIILMEKNLKIRGYDSWLLRFYVISLTLTLMCTLFPYFQFGDSITVIIRLVFYAIVVYTARRYFNFGVIKKVYYRIVFIFSAYLIAQYIYHVMTGGYLPIYLNHAWQFPPEARSASLASIYRFNYRASSLFLEPSYFTFFSLPAVCLLLYQNVKSHFDKITLITTIVAIALSTASSGIIGVVIIFSCFLFGRSNQNLTRRFGVAIAAILLSVGYLTIFESASTWTINRLISGGSINERIVRGLLVYEQLPFVNKIIGVGLNNLGAYMQANDIATMYDEANLNYASSIVQTLNYSGIVGELSLLGYYYHMFCKCRLSGVRRHGIREKVFGDGVAMTMLILLVYTSFFEAILFTYRFAYLVILVEGVRRIEAERD